MQLDFLPTLLLTDQFRDLSSLKFLFETGSSTMSSNDAKPQPQPKGQEDPATSVMDVAGDLPSGSRFIVLLIALMVSIFLVAIDMVRLVNRSVAA